MNALPESIAVLAEICQDGASVATVRAILANDRLKVEIQTEANVSRECRDALESVCAGTITLLPNGMLRIAHSDRGATTDLGDAVVETSGGKLRLVGNRDEIERGLSMKQRVWTAEKHTIPFHRLVERLGGM